jgi:transcriptional regulator with XRE-family HTH domain
MVQQNDRPADQAGTAATADPAEPSVMSAVAGTVRGLRHSRGLSADQLAARAGVSKGALVALENATANPNLATLVRIADALGVPVSTLVEQAPARPVVISDATTTPPLWRGPGGGTARLLLTTPTAAPVELWRWHLGPGEAYDSHPHPAGVVETVTIIAGRAVLVVDGSEHPVGDGMTATFAADVSHSYRGGPAGAELLMTVHLPAATRKADI